MASRRRSHLAAVPTRKSRPALVRPWLGHCPRHDVRGRRQLREPHVEEVALREILLPDPARRAPDGTQTGSLIGKASTTEPDDANGHGHEPSDGWREEGRGAGRARIRREDGCRCKLRWAHHAPNKNTRITSRPRDCPARTTIHRTETRLPSRDTRAVRRGVRERPVPLGRAASPNHPSESATTDRPPLPRPVRSSARAERPGRVQPNARSEGPGNVRLNAPSANPRNVRRSALSASPGHGQPNDRLASLGHAPRYARPATWPRHRRRHPDPSGGVPGEADRGRAQVARIGPTP